MELPPTVAAKAEKAGLKDPGMVQLPQWLCRVEDGFQGQNGSTVGPGARFRGLKSCFNGGFEGSWRLHVPAFRESRGVIVERVLVQQRTSS